MTGKTGVKVQVMQVESHLTTGHDAGMLIALNGGTKFPHLTYCTSHL